MTDSPRTLPTDSGGRRRGRAFRAARYWAQSVQSSSRCLAFWAQYRRILGPSGIVAREKRLLVVSFMGNFLAGIQQEGMLVKALQLRGCEPYIVSDRLRFVALAYRVFGFERFVWFNEYLRDDARALAACEARELVAKVKSLADLLALRYQEVAVGKHVASTLIRTTYRFEFDMRAKRERDFIEEMIRVVILNVFAARRVMDEIQPEIALFLERGYSPYGEFFDLCVNRGINTIQWCGCHRESAIMLKRYSLENADRHPASLSAKSWNVARSMPWSQGHDDALHHELYGNYVSGKWFSEVGTQFNKRIIDREELIARLGLDPGKMTAVIFAHIFWDASFFWGEDLFESYEEWLVETVRSACANDRLNWIVKLHPANIVKLRRDGYVGEPAETTVLREKVGPLPPHVRVLEGETDVNTYALFYVMNFCLTVRGTIGIEAAAFGATVLTAGSGRYDGYGFTVDSQSREAYMARLAALPSCPESDALAVDLAKRFAHASFVMRPFNLASMKTSNANDRLATRRIDISLRSAEELEQAPDLRSFAAWALDTRAEDYLDTEAARDGGRVLVR